MVQGFYQLFSLVSTVPQKMGGAKRQEYTLKMQSFRRTLVFGVEANLPQAGALKVPLDSTTSHH